MKINDELIDSVRNKYCAIADCLTEKGRRLWSAAEALSYGRGGVVLVNKATYISRTTIYQGIKEIQDTSSTGKQGIRKKGGGRKKAINTQKELISNLNGLIDPTTRGDPESPLRWTCKSTRKLAYELQEKGFTVSHTTVATLLVDLNYSLQANKKTLEGSQHEDRDAQFKYINASIIKLQKLGQPTISVDTKKKELIGNYKNNGREFCPTGQPILVKTHDFPDKKLGKVAPYGIYDIGKNKGWVSVGISSDTAEFAVNSIRTWWYKMGFPLYSLATELLITADCGGSNGNRVRLWKFELQKFSDEIGLKISVHHFPPGTSKWNKIEHRLFSYISQNWRGQPLISRETVVNLISNTKTDTGLEVRSMLDKNHYQKGKKITNSEMDTLNIQGDNFHPEWNYTISPRL